jgi:hypothetical protein
MTKSNSVECSTEMARGFVPRKIFLDACKLGCEGLRQHGSPYVSGRWIKVIGHSARPRLNPPHGIAALKALELRKSVGWLDSRRTEI